MRHAVILAGGVGERFWPLSRRERPKQFLPLGGSVSLLRATFERVRGIAPPERVWVVTNAAQARAVLRELPELPAANVLREPRGRNTAPAVYLASLAALRRDPAAVLVVVPSDAWIPEVPPYRRALRAALDTAAAGDRLVLVGVHPTRAETGYGYIEPAAPASGPVSVKRFVEKPGAAAARRFLSRGRHLWNAGIFAWSGTALRRAVAFHLPELARAFTGLERGRWTPKTLGAAYDRAPAVSVDYGILERANNVSVVPGSFRWDDLGSWGALERLGTDGAFSHGETVVVDAPGSVVWAEDGAVAVVGVPGVVVVHVRDATLVVAKERAQDVRRVVEELRRRFPAGRYTRR